MKFLISTLAGLILLVGVSGEAMAACSNTGTWSQVTDLVTTLTNNHATLGMTACSAAGQGTQEEHHNDFELWDYKCGNAGSPSTGVGTPCEKPGSDIRSKLGTWSVSPDGLTVSYDYTSFQPNAHTGPFTVYRDGTSSSYDFCDAGGSSVGIFTLNPTLGTSPACP